jgi:carbamoyltransferase
VGVGFRGKVALAPEVVVQRQLFEYHPLFGYRFIPGLKARIDHEGGGYLVRVNQAGFRSDREFEPTRREHGSRVLVFGDSYTAGDGVSNRHRYSDVLESLVPGLETYNFGLSGTGTDQQYLIHREHAGRIEHDAIVIGVLVENIRRVAARYRRYQSTDGARLVMAKPYFEVDANGELELRNVPVPPERLPDDAVDDRDGVDRGGRFEWVRGVVNRLGPTVKDLVQRVSHYQPLPQYDAATTPEWRLMRAILARWIAEAKRPVILCPIPLYHYIEDTASADAYRDRFRELAAGSGAVLHDPLDDFRRFPAAERRSFRFEVDCHLTPSAHRVLAESLAPTIRSVIEKSAR